MLYPLQIATRGLLDGEYGKATRGYIICPDIVPRWPDAADVQAEPDAFWAVVDEDFLRATLSEHPTLTLRGLFSEESLLVAEVDPDAFDWVASVAEADLVAEIFADDDAVVGGAEESELSGDLAGDGMTGEVTDEDVDGTIATDGVVGETEDEPPHC